MTDGYKKRPGSASLLNVATAALAGFLIILTFLGFQMRAGHDPVLKPTVAVEQPSTVLHRRIVKTRVIVTDAPPRSQSAGTGSSSTSGSPAVSVPAVVTRAPVQAVPVAPAPPPPPVTRTS